MKIPQKVASAQQVLDGKQKLVGRQISDDSRYSRAKNETFLRFSITVFSDIYLLQTTVASKNVMRYKSLIETHHIQVQVQFQLF